AARALLQWSAAELAREAALGLATIKRAELADGETSMTMANDLAVRRTLEAAGVEFIDDNGGGPGVRLGQRPRPKTLREESEGCLRRRMIEDHDDPQSTVLGLKDITRCAISVRETSRLSAREAA